MDGSLLQSLGERLGSGSISRVLPLSKKRRHQIQRNYGLPGPRSTTHDDGGLVLRIGPPPSRFHYRVKHHALLVEQLEIGRPWIMSATWTMSFMLGGVEHSQL